MNITLRNRNTVPDPHHIIKHFSGLGRESRRCSGLGISENEAVIKGHPLHGENWTTPNVVPRPQSLPLGAVGAGGAKKNYVTKKGDMKTTHGKRDVQLGTLEPRGGVV